MWSNVEEKITDGASGLSPNSSPAILFVGASSKGTVNKAYSLGKRSNIAGVLGLGLLPNALVDCQKNMADVSIVAVRANGDVAGTIGVVVKTPDTAGDVIVSGSPAYADTVTVEVLSQEDIVVLTSSSNVADYRTVPESRVLQLADLGLDVLLPDTITKGDSWTFSTTSPQSSRESLKAAVDAALEIYTPEAVIVCQNSTASDATYWGTLAEEYFETEHKPVLIVIPSDLASGSYEDTIADKVDEFSRVDARFVSVLCQPGTVLNGSSSYARSPLGLLAATLTKSSVAESIGATRNFAVANFNLPEDWTNAHSRALDEARFITLRTYAGYSGIYWSNGRTMANDTSDYRYIEIVRTVHKAIRLSRRASLPYMHAPGDDIGVENLLSEIRGTLTKMTGANPKELTGFEVEAPSGQDIPNNGVEIELTLYGVPIIRKIVLNFAYKYSSEA